DLVVGLPRPTRIMILPFDTGVHFDQARTFSARPSRAALSAYLHQLEANGQSTWIYESIDAAMTELQGLADGHRTRPQALFIYTDGLDNGPHQETSIQDISHRIRLQRNDFPYLYTYYGDLKRQLNPRQTCQLTQGGWRVTAGFA